ncbi:MAG TPA: YceI family protein [Gemmatimonadaceae bacterium]|jgi:polyisoprenoid-binding protein YceI|nr:YceI family protein [Gemmatimonadaceae bacterium]
MSDTITTWNIDSSHAEIGFAVRHLMIATVRGRFGAVSGTVTVDETHPEKSTVDVTVDVASIDTRQEMRDNHLRSPDFFDVANHPTMHFVSKRIEGEVRGEFRLIGDLTIRGVTREVALTANLEGRTRDPWGNERAGFSVSGKINRHDFGLTWNQALESGGVMVGDEVKLTIDVELVHQVEATSAAA